MCSKFREHLKAVREKSFSRREKKTKSNDKFYLHSIYQNNLKGNKV